MTRTDHGRTVRRSAAAVCVEGLMLFTTVFDYSWLAPVSERCLATFPTLAKHAHKPEQPR